MPAKTPLTPDTIPSDRYLLIIGAMKSSTSSLFDYLQQHEQICPSFIKEPEYFSEKPVVSISKYEELWNFEKANHRYVMEASTGYTKKSDDQIADRIYDYGVRPKLIYVLREPLSRIESHYNFMKFGMSQDWNLDIDDEHLLETSRYFAQAEKYRRKFGDGSLLLIMMDDFITKKPNCIKSIFDFLALPALDQAIEVPRSNSLANRLSGRYRAIARNVPKPVRQILPSSIKDMIKKFDRKTKQHQEEKLTEAQRAQVRERLAPDMLALRDNYGIDTARWGF